MQQHRRQWIAFGVRAALAWSIALALGPAVACSGDDSDSASDSARQHEDGGDQIARLNDAGEEHERETDAAEPTPGAGTTGGGHDGGSSPSGGAGTSGAHAGSGGVQAGTGGAAGGGGGSDAGTGGAGGEQAGAGGEQAGAGGEPAEPTTCYDLQPGALFCDDFEAPQLPGWSRYSEGPDGRTSHTTQRVHGGQGALESVKVDPGSSDPIYRDVLGGRTAGHLYLRSYLYVPASFAITPAGSRASLLVLGEDSGALGGLSLVLWEDALSLQINGQVVSDVKATYQLPRNAWVCVQIDFAIAAAGSARLRVDGQVVAEGARNTLMPTHYERLWMGVNWVAPEQSETVRAFYDDLFVGTADIACD